MRVFLSSNVSCTRFKMMFDKNLYKRSGKRERNKITLKIPPARGRLMRLLLLLRDFFFRKISESTRRGASGERNKKKEKNEECDRKNVGFARRTRVALFDLRWKNPELYWESRIATAMLRTLMCQSKRKRR